MTWVESSHRRHRPQGFIFHPPFKPTILLPTRASIVKLFHGAVFYARTYKKTNKRYTKIINGKDSSTFLLKKTSHAIIFSVEKLQTPFLMRSYSWYACNKGSSFSKIAWNSDWVIAQFFLCFFAHVLDCRWTLKSATWDTLLLAGKTLILPILEHVNIIWVPFTQVCQRGTDTEQKCQIYL